MYILYYLSGIIIVPGIILSLYAQMRVKSTFNKYSKVPSLSNWTASDLSRMLLERAGIDYVSVRRIGGSLSDNYNPQNDVLSLSDSTYNSNSVASLAVCAHEVGHAVQKYENYPLFTFRSFLVGVTNVGTRLSIPLAIIGIIIEWLATSTASSSYEFGRTLIALGIFCYALTTVFALITLPVELNASKRAGAMLYDSGVLTSVELKQAKQVLWAAALTYVASLVVSFLYLLRFIVILSQFTRKRRD